MLKIKQEVPATGDRLATVDNIKCPCILRNIDNSLVVLVFKRSPSGNFFDGVVLRDDHEKSAEGGHFCLTISEKTSWFFSDEEFTISNGPIV